MQKDQSTFTDEECIEAYNAWKELGSQVEAARAIGITRSALQRRLTRYNLRFNNGIDTNGREWSETRKRDLIMVDIESTGDRVRDVEDAATKAGIDLEYWYVHEVKVGAWDVTLKVKQGSEGELPVKSQNQRIAVTFKRKIPDKTAQAVEALSKLQVKSWPTLTRPEQNNSGLMAEISLIDHHFGKHAWGRQTGDDYDLKIASDLYSEAACAMVDAVRDMGLERVLFVVGHDLLHSEGSTESTAGGTPLDCDSRWQKVYETAFQSVTSAIELFVSEVAPVDVVVVPCNHAPTTTYYFGHALEQRYRFLDEVTVDNDPKTRKKYRWGKVLLGLCHGNRKLDPKESDLPLDMAQQWKYDWADTEWREWHLGDQHRKQSGRTPSYERDEDTIMGVRVKRLPSLCGADAWHYGHAYHGLRESELMIWSKDQGPKQSMMFPMQVISST